MILLGLSWGVTSTAAVMIDGCIVASSSEERYNRIKNYDTWPKEAIEDCLSIAGVKPSDIDHVVWGSKGSLTAGSFFTHRYCSFSVKDFIREQEKYWWPLFYEQHEPDYLEIFPEKIDIAQFPGPKYLEPIRNMTSAEQRDIGLKQLRDTLPDIHLGIAKGKSVFLNHHLCHAAYAAYAIPNDTENLLVFTMDGYGDNENATVWLLENGKLKKLYGTNNFILGRLYRYTTLILNMKMIEHEYKVMGLAPYSKPYYSDAPYDVYASTMKVDGTDVSFLEKPTDSYFFFKERLKGMRFDGIAGGLQRYTEDVICQWVSNWMERTGVRNVAFSGGVSMNVKANLEILKRCKPKMLLVPGSGGDESLAIGACYEFSIRQGERVEPMENMYLGTEVTIEDGITAGKKLGKDARYRIVNNFSNQAFAELLARGKIIGRCSGRMEFGARALGNRSIIADPRNNEIVRTINDKIKSRDFWMPFAPAVMYERRYKYFDYHDGADYSSMTMAAETTEEGKKQLSAALHAADDTARPQIVNKQQNPSYYDLISEFEKLTGVGGVLNTSLNIHGLPIVRNADDAIHVLENTDIDGIVIGDTLILKN